MEIWADWADWSRPSRACGLKRRMPNGLSCGAIVTPLAGVWIETTNQAHSPSARRVTPLAGVWIETLRGDNQCRCPRVTPLAGVWIETAISTHAGTQLSVTPLAGVWIETFRALQEFLLLWSRPSRACGLKLLP